MDLPPFHCKRMALLTTAGVQIIHETSINDNTDRPAAQLLAPSDCIVPWGFYTMSPVDVITAPMFTTRLTTASEKTLACLCCAHRDHCGAEAVSCGVSGSRQGRAMTGFSVCCWTGDSWGQRFTVPSAPSLSLGWLWEAQGKGLMRTTRKRRGIWQQPFPPHPEGQQSSSVAARGGKQGAYCDINMDGVGGGGQVTPWVGVSYREAHCEAEEGGGGAVWWQCTCAQNKRMWINEIGTACVHETPRPSSNKGIFSDCCMLWDMRNIHTHTHTAKWSHTDIRVQFVSASISSHTLHYI